MSVLRRRVGRGTGLVATPGFNKFVIRIPNLFFTEYPEHFKHITFYGRLISDTFIVNLDVDFTYSPEV